MDKQQNAPVLTPLILGGRLNPIWQKWFQKLKTRDDEVRRRPYKTYTASQDLTTWELGKTVLFHIGTSNATAALPAMEEKDLWAWITIVRIGTGLLTIRPHGDSRIERIGVSIDCGEPNRAAANVTLQLITLTQWAIIGATGIWRVNAL